MHPDELRIPALGSASADTGLHLPEMRLMWDKIAASYQKRAALFFDRGQRASGQRKTASLTRAQAHYAEARRLMNLQEQ